MRSGVIINEIPGCRFEEFNVVVIPLQSLVVEPSAIEPIALIVGSTTGPFLIWFSNRLISVSEIVNLTSVVIEVLVVLILGARDARQKGRVHRLLMSQSIIGRSLRRRGVLGRDTNIFWLKFHSTDRIR